MTSVQEKLYSDVEQNIVGVKPSLTPIKNNNIVLDPQIQLQAINNAQTPLLHPSGGTGWEQRLNSLPLLRDTSSGAIVSDDSKSSSLLVVSPLSRITLKPNSTNRCKTVLDKMISASQAVGNKKIVIMDLSEPNPFGGPQMGFGSQINHYAIPALIMAVVRLLLMDITCPVFLFT